MASAAQISIYGPSVTVMTGRIISFNTKTPDGVLVFEHKKPRSSKMIERTVHVKELAFAYANGRTVTVGIKEKRAYVGGGQGEVRMAGNGMMVAEDRRTGDSTWFWPGEDAEVSVELDGPKRSGGGGGRGNSGGGRRSNDRGGGNRRR